MGTKNKYVFSNFTAKVVFGSLRKVKHGHGGVNIVKKYHNFLT